MEQVVQSFKLNDEVVWTSQSKGYVSTKEGRIVAVVPAKSHPDNHIPHGFSSKSQIGFGHPRPHESYLIQVGDSKKLYWPLVSKLNKAE